MKTLMHFVLPVSHKYLLYAAENAAESSQFSFILDSKKTSSQEYFTSATRRVETYGYELMRESEVRHFLKESALNLKRCMQKFLRCEREIQKLTLGLDQYIFERILPALESHKAFEFIKWASTVYKNYDMIGKYDSLAKMASVFGVLNNPDRKKRTIDRMDNIKCHG
eukprot:TRINITY_DN3651_c0_g3_i2.p2 TRINITY_DN3651_c0_g3~~TRINITY_DN3651_c0_g3_i2.p2  ORF type:complete len:167 (+),score=29.30 TRINITY_DN3651_c0_g3_i2:1755-2255(+)